MIKSKSLQLKRITVAVAVATACFAIPMANAETWLEDFYTQAGAGMNVSAPGVFESQSSNLITGGSLSVRVPPKNIQLYNFNPPSLKMGCGGIDLWAGSFSFVNKAQFIAYLRNVGQNALGMFFELAVKTMAPEIHSVMTRLQALSQQMNSNSLNACETSKRMFAGAIPETNESSTFTERMGSFASALGTVTDNLQSIDTYTGDLKTTFNDLRNIRATTPAAIKNSGGKDETPVDDYNLVYRALTNSGATPFSQNEINLIMSLTGTIIVHTPKTGGPEQLVTEYIAPTVTNLKEFIGVQNAMSSFAMNVCDPANECLTVTQDPAGVHQFNSFAKISNDKITAMRDAIANRVVQNPATIDYLTQSSIPIYRMLAITTKFDQLELSDNVIAQYSDAAAIDMTSVFIKNLMKEVQRVSKTYKASSSAEIERLNSFYETLKDINSEADELLTAKQLQLAQLSYQINTVDHYNRIMLRGLSEKQKQAIAFK